jgi:hypothetical protein
MPKKMNEKILVGDVDSIDMSINNSSIEKENRT